MLLARNTFNTNFISSYLRDGADVATFFKKKSNIFKYYDYRYPVFEKGQTKTQTTNNNLIKNETKLKQEETMVTNCPLSYLTS